MLDAQFVPAPFWRRLFARTIDLLICIPLTFAAIIVVLIPTLGLMPLLGEERATALGAFICFVLAYVAIEYFLLRRRGGQTLGKGLLGLRVLNSHDDSGTKPITNRAALMRMAILIGPMILGLAAFYITYDAVTETSTSPVVDGLLYLWFLVLFACAVSAVLDRGARRGLHDFAAGTRVVRAQKRGVSLREDLAMLVPGKVDMTKYRAPAALLTMTKPPPQDNEPSAGPQIDFTKRS